MQLLQIEPAPRHTAASHHITTLPILLLNIHTLCNCRCVMCDIWKQQQGEMITVTDLEPQRQSFINLRVRQVVLSGGEPLLNPGLAAICTFFRSLGIRITILTTGLLLQKRAALVASLADEIILSLDGPSEIHDGIRRIPRAFQTITRGVRSIRTLNPALPVSCRTTVQKQNHTYLRATVQAAHSIGLTSISFLPADLSSSAFNRDPPWHTDRQDEIALTPAELLAFKSEIELLIASHRSDIDTHFIAEDAAKLRRLATRFEEHLTGSTPQAPACNAPWVSAVVEVDGSVRPCFFHAPTASIRRLDSAPGYSLEQALNSHDASSFRGSLDVATNPICRRCVCSLNLKPDATVRT